MKTAEIKKLPEWPKIEEAINLAIKDSQDVEPDAKIELLDTGEQFFITSDGIPIMEIDGSFIQ